MTACVWVRVSPPPRYVWTHRVRQLRLAVRRTGRRVAPAAAITARPPTRWPACIISPAAPIAFNEPFVGG